KIPVHLRSNVAGLADREDEAGKRASGRFVHQAESSLGVPVGALTRSDLDLPPRPEVEVARELCDAPVPVGHVVSLEKAEAAHLAGGQSVRIGLEVGVRMVKAPP